VALAGSPDRRPRPFRSFDVLQSHRSRSYYESVVDVSIAAKDVPAVARREHKDRARTQAFGARVRELREAKGMTQEALADAAELHRAEIGFVERAEREVGITLAWRLADGLDVTLAALVQGLD